MGSITNIYVFLNNFSFSQLRIKHKNCKTWNLNLIQKCQLH